MPSFVLEVGVVSVVEVAKSSLVERTNVGTLNSGVGGTETQTNVLVPSAATLARTSALGLDLGVLENVRLLLESTLRLDGQLGRPTQQRSVTLLWFCIMGMGIVVVIAAMRAVEGSGRLLTS